MRICLLGECNENLDEAMIKTTHYLSKELSKNNAVLNIDLRDFLKLSFWKEMREFQPEIIHYIPGSTSRSFILLWLCKQWCNRARSLISIMHPDFSDLKFYPRFFKPDLVLVGSIRANEIFSHLSLNTKFFPLCGVDTDRFSNVSDRRKEDLRRKYKIDPNKFVVLHIGSIKRGRNIETLGKIQSNKIQVLIVGSPSADNDKEIINSLINMGCDIRLNYYPEINELYNISDCYLFPIKPHFKKETDGIVDCVEIPLTVIEAMACNLPIISTEFGGLPHLFEQGQGFSFYDNLIDVDRIIERLSNKRPVIQTRKQVLPYDWANTVNDLEELYDAILRGSCYE